MKKLLVLFLTIILTMLLISCNSEDKILENKAETQEIPTSKNGLVLASKKQSYKKSDKELGATLLNEGTTEVTTGTYLFPQKNIDGVWYDIPYKADYLNEGANILEPNQSAEYTLDVSLLKYKLTPGDYRFLVLGDGPAAPFKITD